MRNGEGAEASDEDGAGAVDVDAAALESAVRHGGSDDEDIVEITLDVLDNSVVMLPPPLPSPKRMRSGLPSFRRIRSLPGDSSPSGWGREEKAMDRRGGLQRVREIMEAAALGNQKADEEGSDEEEYVVVTLDPGEDDTSQRSTARRGGGRELRRQASSLGMSQELRSLASINRGSARRRFDRSDSAFAHVLKVLDFVGRREKGDVFAEWSAVEKRFDQLAQDDGRLHRSKFGLCIGVEEQEFAGELFKAMARARNISGDSISKEELFNFLYQISRRSLETFFEMVDKNTDVRITEEEVKEIIALDSSAEKLSEEEQEDARMIMEYLDPSNHGYIDLYNLKLLLLQVPNQSVRIEKSHSRTLSQTLSQTLASEMEPSRLRRWYGGALRFLEDNWPRVWVLLLWLSLCTALFTWKFVQHRRRTAFRVMGYCVCVAQGGAETLKLNMALALLPVCRNAITWLRGRTAVGRAVPLDDNINFHMVTAVGIAVGAVLHVVPQLACGFPRLLRATDAEYAPLARFFGATRPPGYGWFLGGTEGWTGLVMLVLMSVASVLATGWFRRGRIRLPRPLHRLTGFNAFWYSHHLFVVVYVLLIVHGHFVYLTEKWYEKTTWMYLAVPMVLYACDRLTRALRSVRPLKTLKVAVYPGNVLALHFSKPQGFTFKSGQYIYLNCPSVSVFEWHPFHITSAPQDDYISVHIRTLGDWTYELKSIYSRRLTTEKRFAMSNSSLPKVLIDGPYSTAVQEHTQYDNILLIGMGIGATPMVSIMKDIANNMKLLNDDLESGSKGDGSPTPSLRRRRAYFYWVMREQSSFGWLHDVMDEVAHTDERAVIEIHMYCTNEYTEGGVHSALVAMLQSLSHAKQGVDAASGTRVKTHFARPNWHSVFKRLAVYHGEQKIGVFYCGAPALGKELHALAQDFSRKTNTKFEFHTENF